MAEIIAMVVVRIVFIYSMLYELVPDIEMCKINFRIIAGKFFATSLPSLPNQNSNMQKSRDNQPGTWKIDSHKLGVDANDFISLI